MIRPAGIAPGAAAFAASWFAALAIVMLTGATAVVILLAVGAVGFLLAAIAGAFALRRVVVDEVATDELGRVRRRAKVAQQGDAMRCLPAKGAAR